MLSSNLPPAILEYNQTLTRCASSRGDCTDIPAGPAGVREGEIRCAKILSAHRALVNEAELRSFFGCTVGSDSIGRIGNDDGLWERFSEDRLCEGQAS